MRKTFGVLCAFATALWGCDGQLPEAPPHQAAGPEAAEPPAAAPPVSKLLPAYPLPGERKVPGKADKFDDFRNQNPQWYSVTASPASLGFNFRALREWESMQELQITYSDALYQDPSGVPDTLADIVYHTIVDAQTPVTVVWAMPQVKSDLVSRLKARGLTQADIDTWITWRQIANNSIWHIDFGPVPLVRDDGRIAYADFRYYHNRIHDDAIPTRLGWLQGIDTFRMPVSMEGGNFQADGAGVCYTSQRGLQLMGTSMSEFHKAWHDYLGCDKIVVLNDITDDGTGHIDMFFKLVDQTTAIVGTYDPSYQADAVNEQRMDENQAILEATTTASGQPITVYRMPFPSKVNDPYSSGMIPRTYLNATFVNGVNLWPIYTTDKAAEAAALQVWQDVMPSWQHVGIVSDDIALLSGTIHCVTRTVPVGTMDHWLPTSTCSGGQCVGAAPGAYNGTCDANTPCKGPAWECNCNDCNACGANAGLSCVGYCGTQAPGGCWCDDQCQSYGDCCADVGTACGCIPSCPPGVQCGDDGCGGSCGGCLPGESCVNGWCTPSGGCVPNCVGKQCGDDGCGGSCGTCPSGQQCDASGQCMTSCVPDCAGKQCGSDGCGGSCGTCPSGQQCDASGQCAPIAYCAGACGGQSKIALCYCDSLCTQYGDCCPDYQTTCGGGCVPDCAGKQCGDDGCGGSCGTCQALPGCTAGGDVTGNGSTDVADVQCTILAALAELGTIPAPACLAGVPGAEDLNCDGLTNVVDVTLTVRLALSMPFDPALDANGDQCVDACQPTCVGGTCQ